MSDTSSELLAVCAPFASEKLAELAALELLCPLPDRIKVAGKRRSAPESISDMSIAKEFGVPLERVSAIFNDRQIKMMASLFEAAKKI